ncbi:MAG: M15 family metallopeptidase [Bacilli bacterium]|jgi:D-alanyl-D-alanine carboxypeptidase|nr:M15 family metallopeptidase [Bacilli bacterium]
MKKRWYVLLIIILLLVISFMQRKDLILLNINVDSEIKTIMKEKLSAQDLFNIWRTNYNLDNLSKEIKLDDYQYKNQGLYDVLTNNGAHNYQLVIKKSNAYLNEGNSIDEIKALIKNDDNKTYFIKMIDEGIYNEIDAKMVINPEKILSIANYRNNIYKYVPNDLELVNDVPLFDNDQYFLRKDTHQALQSLCDDLEKTFSNKCGDLVITSTYRSYQEQKELFQSELNKSNANIKLVLPAGASEHQLGNTVDMMVSYVTKENYQNTKQYQWIAKHAAEYGFIIRYPQDKEAITKISFEPWHLRYVGKEDASQIMSQKLCLEEYVDENK